MPVLEKYRCNRQVGWSDEAEVHSGPVDAKLRVAVVVKLCHGMGGGAMRPGGKRDQFLQAARDQEAAAKAGCKFVTPIFETGEDGECTYYVTRHYPRSIDSLIQGRVTVDHPGLQRLTDGLLKALEELRDKHGRPHGNLKPANVFIDGKTLTSATVVLGDLAPREQAGNQAADCYEIGATLYQLVRGRMVKNIDWPMVAGPDWEKLGPMADAWRRFFNVLMAPNLSNDNAALATARKAFKNMRSRAAVEVDLGGHSMVPVDRGKKTKAAGGTAGAAPPRKGLFAGIGAGVAALVGALVVWVQPPGTKWADRLKGAVGLASVVQQLPSLPRSTPPPEQSTPVAINPTPAATGTPGRPTPTAAPATPAPTPLVADMTPPPTPPPTPTAAPTPVSESERWIGYLAMLERFKTTINDPAGAEQPEILNAALTTFKGDMQYQQVASDPTVEGFLRRLPPKLEATGDQADLPAALWTKVSAARDGDVQTVVYKWNKSGAQMQFNRVALPGGPSFFLSATTVPVSLGFSFMTMPEAAGKVRGMTNVNAPVAWQASGLRPAWINPDAANADYARTGGPTPDCPMNGISGSEALALARAASCALPTLGQWTAVLGSTAGADWLGQWQARAKVRGTAWATFAKGIKARSITGSLLPNTRCFGDQLNLEPVGAGSDANLFFESVGSRMLHGYAHLIGNVGQYIVDNAQAPTKYYFAGGSAQSAPAVFADLKSPPAVPNQFTYYADAGFRLVTAAKGNGSDKNPALDKLKADLDVELARVQAIR